MAINKLPILVVDDEVEMRLALSATLKKCGFTVDLSHNANDAVKKFSEKEYCLVLSDMTMPKMSGVELLKKIKAINPTVPFIIMTAHGTIETAIESMKLGAFDYILKPFDFNTIVFLIERALTTEITQSVVSKESKAPSTTNDAKIQPGKSRSEGKEIITSDPVLKELLVFAEKAAQSNASIMILSESGTGKELLARFIHEKSDRKDMPFVAVNCAALPDTLLESELFGYKKGAFTGAVADQKGKFEQANGGTILLDEISEMHMQLQAKLLRVLQEGAVDKIGSTETLPVNVRVIATTNRDIDERIRDGKFREDLFFRLNVIPMRLPALRERKGDIRLLTEFFLDRYLDEVKLDKRPPVSDETYRVLESYSWRGNVRELENVIERALILSSGSTIEPKHLLMSGSIVGFISDELKISNKSPDPLRAGLPVKNIRVGMKLKEAQRLFAQATLDANDGDTEAAASILGISEKELETIL